MSLASFKTQPGKDCTKNDQQICKKKTVELVESWALAVIINFFNAENFFCIFYQVNLTGCRLSK